MHSAFFKITGAGSLARSLCAKAGLGDTLRGLHEDPNAAAGVKGFDPMAFAVNGYGGLEAWVARLDEFGVSRTPIIKSTTGWLVAVDAPDGMHILPRSPNSAGSFELSQAGIRNSSRHLIRYRDGADLQER